MKQVVFVGNISDTLAQNIRSTTGTNPYPIITGASSADIAAQLAIMEWRTSDVAVFALAQDTFESLTVTSGTASHTYTNAEVETFETTATISGMDVTTVSFTPPTSAGWLEGSFDWAADGVITHSLLDPNDREVDYSYGSRVVFERNPTYVGTPVPLQFWYPKTVDGEWSMVLNPREPIDTTVDCSVRYHPGYEQTISVPLNAKWLNVSVTWDNVGTDVNLALIDPDGRLVQWAPAGSLYSALVRESMNMPYPSSGDWTVLAAWMNATAEQNILSFDWAISTMPDDLQAHLESAANGAVIASLMNAPLLYVSRNGVPEVTRRAAEKLGVNLAILVDPNNIHSTTLLQQINFGPLSNVNTHSMLSSWIRTLSHQNDIIISTPLATGDEILTTGAYSGAVHGAPVFSLCGEYNQMTTRAEETWNPYMIGPELNVYVTSQFTTRTENGWYDERIPNTISMMKSEEDFEEFLTNREAFNDTVSQSVMIISPVDLIKISFDRSIQSHFSPGRIPAKNGAIASVWISRAASHRFLHSIADNADSALLSLYAYTENYGYGDNFNRFRTLNQIEDTELALTSAGFNIENHVGYNEVFATLDSEVAFWEISTHGTLTINPTDPPERPGAVGYFSMRDLDTDWGYEESPSVRDVDNNKIVNPVMFEAEHSHHMLRSTDDLENAIDNIGSPIVILCACLLGGTQMPIMLMEHGAVGVIASPRTVYFQPAGMLSVLVTESLADGNTTGKSLSSGLRAVSADYSNPIRPGEPSDYANQQVLFGDPNIKLYNPLVDPHITAIDPLNASFGGHTPGRGIPRIAAIGETNYLPETLSSLNLEFEFFGGENYSEFLEYIQLRQVVLTQPGLTPYLVSIIAANSNKIKDFVQNGGTLVALGVSGNLNWAPLNVSFIDDSGGNSITIVDSTHPLVSVPTTISSSIGYEGYFEDVSSNFSIIATDGSNPVIVAASIGSGKAALTTTRPTGQERNNTITNAIAWNTMPSLFLQNLELSQQIIWAGDRVGISLKITDFVGTDLSEVNLEVWLNDTDVSNLVQEDPTESGLFHILLDEQWTSESVGFLNIHLRATKPGYDTLSLTLIGYMYIRPSPWPVIIIGGGIIGLLLVSWIYVKYKLGDAIIPRRQKKGYSPYQEPSKKERKQRRERQKKKREKEDKDFDAEEFFGV
jgi:hypothetical protein